MKTKQLIILIFICLFLWCLEIFVLITARKKAEEPSYTITQCDKDYHEAVIYIEMGASEREQFYKEKCEESILLDRYTGCFSLICK